MNLSSVAPAPVQPSIAAAPKGGVVAETRGALTPATGKLVTDASLDFRLGRGKLAGAIGDSIRFRVTGTGPMSQRTLVPDSPSAQAVMQGREGAALITQLKIAASSIAGLEDRQDLKVFVLPKDVDGTIAASILGGAETGDEQSAMQLAAMGDADAAKSPELRAGVQGFRKEVNAMYRQGVAAWNQSGVIIFRPDVARSMLTAAGLFKPGPGASKLTSGAKLGADIVNHVPTHEVQHSATPVSGEFYSTPAKWMEEAIAEVLSDTPSILRATAAKTGVNVHTYAGHMAHEPKVDLDWADWKPQKRSAAEQKDNEQQVGRNYARSQDVMRSMLSMAGFSWRSNVQVERMKQFLQSEPVETLANRLASTLADRYDVPSDRVGELAKRIGSVIDDKGGLKSLKADFDLG